MKDLISEALFDWGLAGATARLLARRENVIYRVDPPGGPPRVLRIHRPGYRSADEIRSELRLMARLAESGLCVATPCETPECEVVRDIGGHLVDVLGWVPGDPIASLEGRDRLDAFETLGALAARTHQVLDAWSPPGAFRRPSWDADGLLGETPLWGRFWENPALDAAGRDLIGAARREARARLEAAVGQASDIGLIHADMVGENVLVAEDSVALIDFDDAGTGFRLFEIATILQHQLEAPDYAELRAAVIDGYRRHRAIDLSELDLMLLLRSWTYLGWIMPRMDEPGGAARCEKFARRAVRRAEQWMAGQSLS